MAVAISWQMTHLRFAVNVLEGAFAKLQSVLSGCKAFFSYRETAVCEAWIDGVASYKYRAIWLDGNVSLKRHTGFWTGTESPLLCSAEGAMCKQ